MPIYLYRICEELDLSNEKLDPKQPRREYDDKIQCLDNQLWMLKEIQKDIKNCSARNDKEINKMASDAISR